MSPDYFDTLDTLKTPHGDVSLYRLDRLERAGLLRLEKLPYSIRILLESVLRQCNEKEITRQDVLNLAGWQPQGASDLGCPSSRRV